jgi:hypothetical protein
VLHARADKKLNNTVQQKRPSFQTVEAKRAESEAEKQPRQHWPNMKANDSISLEKHQKSDRQKKNARRAHLGGRCSTAASSSFGCESETNVAWIDFGESSARKDARANSLEPISKLFNELDRL